MAYYRLTNCCYSLFYTWNLKLNFFLSILAILLISQAAPAFGCKSWSAFSTSLLCLSLTLSIYLSVDLPATMDLASLYYGLFLGIFVFTQTKIVQQTTTIWRHKRSLANAYVVMIWVEAWVNFVFALITYLFLNNVIPGRLVSYLSPSQTIIMSVNCRVLTRRFLI